ncbi:MAG: DNA gyrase inhibitor YacG [Pirellulaceae bacterium]|nr:DNA gyrase inhibitor YacG [Pirellulaceae bacterium]
MRISQPAGQPTAKCSHCGTAILVMEPNLMPFCSQRCKELDLSNWLTESYGLAYEGNDSADPSDFSPHDNEDR